jgi:hypothetical protein
MLTEIQYDLFYQIGLTWGGACQDREVIEAVCAQGLHVAGQSLMVDMINTAWEQKIDFVEEYEGIYSAVASGVQSSLCD